MNGISFSPVPTKEQNTKRPSVRLVARALLLVAIAGDALIGFSGSTLAAHLLLIVPAALFLILVVALAAVTSAVDEVLQKLFERIQTLEQSLAAYRPEQG